MTQHTKTLPWEDRWNEPSLDDLTKPIAEQHLPQYQRMLEEIGAFEGVDWKILWHGPGWQWSVRLAIGDPSKEDSETLIYLVPSPERPVYSIPLREETIKSLPKKRLSKYIRDGIRSAKWSVELFWATYSPATDGEITMIIDLVKRKHAHLTSED